MVSNLLVTEVAQGQMVVFVHLLKRLFWATTTGLDRMICVIGLNFDLISLSTMCVRVFVCRTASYPWRTPPYVSTIFSVSGKSMRQTILDNYIPLSLSFAFLRTVNGANVCLAYLYTHISI